MAIIIIIMEARALISTLVKGSIETGTGLMTTDKVFKETQMTKETSREGILTDLVGLGTGAMVDAPVMVVKVIIRDLGIQMGL